MGDASLLLGDLLVPESDDLDAADARVVLAPRCAGSRILSGILTDLRDQLAS